MAHWFAYHVAQWTPDCATLSCATSVLSLEVLPHHSATPWPPLVTSLITISIPSGLVWLSAISPGIAPPYQTQLCGWCRFAMAVLVSKHGGAGHRTWYSKSGLWKTTQASCCKLSVMLIMACLMRSVLCWTLSCQASFQLSQSTNDVITIVSFGEVKSIYNNVEIGI